VVRARLPIVADNPATSVARSRVVDLRQYTLKPGRRDDLIRIFDEYLVAGQEDVGMHIIGQFRDLDRPDRFVWLRGFDSLSARAETLPAFYYGPIWKQHRDAANDTMLDSDDALLLDPLWLSPTYPRYGTRPAVPVAGESVIGITVCYRDRPVDQQWRQIVLDRVLPEAAGAGAEPIAAFVSNPAENNFAALPLRRENAVAWVTRCADDAAWARAEDVLASSTTWREHVLDPLLQTASLPTQRMRLRPTAASHLR
jgi:NIPSNAP